MNREPRSIGEHIDCLARLTGAPGSFVDQVRELFTRKGISLDEEAAPFLTALEEAFRREERIRCSSHRARANLTKIQDNFKKVGKAYVDQLSKLKNIQESLHQQTQRMRKSATPQEKPSTTHVTIKGDHRTFVTRPEREELPMVPGPKEIQ
jgi:hypothetical protein